MSLVIERYSQVTPLGVLVDLLNRCYVETPGFSPVTVRDFVDLKAGGAFRPELLLTAYLDGLPVGLCLALLRPGSKVGSMRWLGVLPDQRRRGVAKTLLARCSEALAAAGANELLVRLDEPRDSVAGRFLEGRGFKVAYNQLLMVRSLDSPIQEATLPASYRLRALGPEEGEAWLRVRNEAFSDEPIASRAWTIEEFRREFVENPYADRGRIFAVEHTGEVVGVVAAWFFPYRNVEMEMAHWLGILHEHRGKDLGRALMTEVLKYFNVRGAKQVRLITQTALPKAVELYRKLGFTVEEEQPVYSKAIP